MVTYVHVTVALLNVDLCNSISIIMIWQHKISINGWMEYLRCTEMLRLLFGEWHIE